jgi:choice-of-anchor C domain-containing protein
LRVADPDVDGNAVQLSLSAGHGGLNLNSHGVTVVGDDGSDGSLVVSGTLANINGALAAGLTYTPDADYNGADVLHVTIDDQGNGGTGALSANQSILIDVDAVTDTHVISTVSDLANGSFEAPLAPAGWFITHGIGVNLGGWVVQKDSIDLVGTLWAAADGIQSVDLNGNDAGRVEQDITTIADATYRVSFELWSNGLVQVAAGDESEGITTSGSTWTQHTFDFTADDASTLLSFESVGAGGPSGPVLDNVEVMRVLENFTVGDGGDVLDLRGLLDSVGGPHDNTAFSGGYLQFDNSGGDTTVLFDADGAAGGAYDYVPVVTLVGATLTQTDEDYYTL